MFVRIMSMSSRVVVEWFFDVFSSSLFIVASRVVNPIVARIGIGKLKIILGCAT